MKQDPLQEELDLVMDRQPIDEFILKGTLTLGAPIVEYVLIWQSTSGGRYHHKCYLDSVWPIDRMSARILSMIFSAHDGGSWIPSKVRAVLDAVQSAYGCEEPF